jgi:O-antigen ligase
MSATTSATARLTESSTVAAANVDLRRFAQRVCQAIVLLPLFGLILLPEYVQGLGDPETKSVLYRATIGPLRMVDALLLALIAGHVVVWASSRRMRVEFPRELRLPGIGFLAAIALAMAFGALCGGTNLFFDWRALALGMGLFGVFALWLQSAQQALWAVELFAGFMTVGIAMIYAEFLRGGGDWILGVRIPVYDGPTISVLAFTAILAVCLCAAARGWRKALWGTLALASYFLVVLCFRRTFWAMLGGATLLLLVVQRRHLGRRLILAAAACAALAAMLGPTFSERVQSMDFTQDGTEFSRGNPDHVGEVLDAWEQVEQHPVFGLGLGRSFQTLRIRGWKEESVMVHNAPLHVWLKYGITGLVCYLWFHAALLRWLWRARRSPSVAQTGQGIGQIMAFQVAALAFLGAQFAVSLGFTPWPYSSLQTTILIAFLLAVAIRKTETWNCQTSPWSLRR